MQPIRQEILLLRTLAAIAWADGSVDTGEKAFLRGLAVEYGLTAEEQDEILSLLETPIPLDQFESYARDFLDSGTEADRHRLLSRAEKLVEADDRTERAELRYLSLLREWTREAQSGARDVRGASGGAKPAFGLVGKLLGKAAPSSLGTAVRSLFTGAGVESVRSPREAYVALFGALLYRVIYADHVVEAREAERLRELLSERFGFTHGEVDTMLRLIQQRVADDHDRQRICAEFNRVTGPEERHELVTALWELASADGEVPSEEEEEIRLISNYLWVEIQDFVAIRRKVIGR